MKYLLAHDLGTSGDKATLFSTEGKLMGSAVHSYDTHYFNDTWVEQDPDDWWNAVCESTRGLLASCHTDPADIAAVSFSGQMMGCLCVDREGRPLRPSIIWADQRARKQAARIEEQMTQWDYYRISGHPNTASYGIQKLMWVKENEPEIYERTYKVLNAKDYIIYRLTGNFYTEYSDGNSNGCFDLQRLAWSEEIIACAGVDYDKLPKLVPSTFVAGGVTKDAAAKTGLSAGTPVVMGGGDGVAASVGAGSVSPGKTYCCLGTSAWVMTCSDQPVFDEQMRTVTWAHIVPGMYAPNGTMQYAGGSYSWLKNTVCRMECYDARLDGTSPYDHMNREIAKSAPGAGGVIFLPYLLGERAPRWNPDARGTFFGIRAETSREDLLRSVMEGITMNLDIILKILQKTAPIDEILVLGGGARGAVWQQILADIFGTRVLVPSVLEEAGSMGAAVTAGVGAGLYKDFSAIDRFLDINCVREPNAANAECYRKNKEIFDELYYALLPVFKKCQKV